MTATYEPAALTDPDDPAYARAHVRLLISDTDVADAIFADEELDGLIARRGSPTRAAASALRIIAGNEAQLLKVMRLQDIDTDGAALARELRMQADRLEDEADLEDDTDGDLVVAEYAGSPFGWRSRLFNEHLRNAAADDS